MFQIRIPLNMRARGICPSFTRRGLGKTVETPKHQYSLPILDKVNFHLLYGFWFFKDVWGGCHSRLIAIHSAPQAIYILCLGILFHCLQRDYNRDSTGMSLTDHHRSFPSFFFFINNLLHVVFPLLWIDQFIIG